MPTLNHLVDHNNRDIDNIHSKRVHALGRSGTVSVSVNRHTGIAGKGNSNNIELCQARSSMLLALLSVILIVGYNEAQVDTTHSTQVVHGVENNM